MPPQFNAGAIDAGSAGPTRDGGTEAARAGGGAVDAPLCRRGCGRHSSSHALRCSGGGMICTIGAAPACIAGSVDMPGRIAAWMARGPCSNHWPATGGLKAGWGGGGNAQVPGEVRGAIGRGPESGVAGRGKGALAGTPRESGARRCGMPSPALAYWPCSARRCGILEALTRRTAAGRTAWRRRAVPPTTAWPAMRARTGSALRPRPLRVPAANSGMGRGPARRHGERALKLL